MSGFRLAWFSLPRWSEVGLMMTSPLLGALIGGGRPTAAFVLATYALGLHAFLVNDWADRRELEAGDGGEPAAPFGWAALAALAVAAVVGASLGPSWQVCAAGIVACSLVYSHPLVDARARPWFSTLTHVVGGVFQFLLGYGHTAGELSSGIPWGLYAALLLAGGHLNHEAMHRDQDMRRGHRTNAVVWGRGRITAASMAAFGSAALVLLGLVATGRAEALVVAPLVVAAPVQAAWWWRLPGPGVLCEGDLVGYRRRYRILYGGAGALTATLLVLRHCASW